MGRLTEQSIGELEATGKAYKRSDGLGLFIFVTAKGSKLWRMSYRFEGRQKLLSFGSWPITTIEDARSKCLAAKRLLRDGKDPSRHAMARQSRRKPPDGSFDAVADELLAKREMEGLANTTLHKKRWLLEFARPAFGHRSLRDIHPADVLGVLREVEARGTHETAKRLRTTIGEVFRYAIATLRADMDPTAPLRGALVRPKVRHMPAIIEPHRFARLVRAVWSYEGRSHVGTALKLMILLYPRPGELRLAEWNEFNLEKATWSIPADRMKMRRPHRKPLASHVIELLRKHRTTVNGSDLLFPSMTAENKPISNNTMNQALRRMGFASDEMTPHGFRASACTFLNETGNWNPDAIEAELAHIDTKSVRSIYNRSLYWNERCEMAEWWEKTVRIARKYPPVIPENPNE